MTAFISVMAMALVMVSSPTWGSHPSESARNQYEMREDRLQPLQLAEATDHRPRVHRIDLGKSPDDRKNLAVPDLQVGCGDGFIHEEIQNQESDKSKLPMKKLAKRRMARRKRSYTPWSGQVNYSPPYQSITVWKAPTYQISRPYYIPIFGISGRPPIYYPPQPLLINPGVPLDNPKRPFQAPPYLPPPEPTTSLPETTMTIRDRFNGGDNSDDRPVWDVNGGATQRPLTTTAIVPTRKTRRPGAPKTHPPLIHNDLDGGSASGSGVLTDENESSPQAAAQARPPPPPPPPSTRRPSTSTPSASEPSRCVWAIISCCSSTGQISYDCFDQRGCPGAFWDSSPCDSDFAKAAIAAALNYYNTK